uniref:Uncharacterized protein n=1 Tax=Arundo donax TaxID=35708 RepID=A0A0A9GSB6_ARUDO
MALIALLRRLYAYKIGKIYSYLALQPTTSKGVA